VKNGEQQENKMTLLDVNLKIEHSQLEKEENSKMKLSQYKSPTQTQKQVKKSPCFKNMMMVLDNPLWKE